MVKDFVPAKKRTSGNNRGVSRVTKKDSGFQYITNKLKPTDDNPSPTTVVRMLPYVDSDGDIYPALNPEGSPKKIEESLGIPFSQTEVVNFYKGGLYTLISEVKEEDKEGNPVNSHLSPWSSFMNRMSFKRKEICKQLEVGGAVEPSASHWANLFESTFSNPQNLWFIQVLASKIDGHMKKQNGEIVPTGPGVFAIPMGIMNKTDFFDKMLTKKDKAPEEEGLKPENCKLGDFYNPETGRPIELSRIDRDGNTTYSMSLLEDPWPVPADKLRELVRDWDEIFDILYVEDSMKEIASIMEPKMVAYAFRGKNYYSKYLSSIGIDPSIADDILEPSRDTFYGNKIRREDELPGNSGKSSGKSQKKSTEKPEEKSSEDTPDEEEEEKGSVNTENNDRYQQELEKLQDNDDLDVNLNL